MITNDPHLKPAHANDLQKKIDNSFPGMAHWAGTGPSGKTCRECAFFNAYNSLRPHDAAGVLKDPPCNKYKALMRRSGEPVPPTANACRFFSQAEKPLALRDRFI